MNLLFINIWGSFWKQIKQAFLLVVGKVESKDIRLAGLLEEDDLELTLPFLLAAHLLHDVAAVRDDQSLLVLAPHGEIGEGCSSKVIAGGCGLI